MNIPLKHGSFARRSLPMLVGVVAQLLHRAAAQEDVSESTNDMMFKFEELKWDEIELHPGKCDSFDQYCLDVPKEDKDDEEGVGTPESLIAKFRDRYPHFSDAWMDEFAREIAADYESYEAADRVGISTQGDSAEISAYAIGLVVDNVYDISYLDNKFKVDMKIFLRQIENKERLTSIEQAFNEAFGPANVVEFANEEDKDKPYVELLEDRWHNVKSDPRYKDAKPIKHSFCSEEYQKKMRLIPMEEYTKQFGAGIQIRNSNAGTTAIADENGLLNYIKASGATISFDPPNSKFFPFQSDIMDITLNFPRGREMNRVVLCIDPHYTALLLPMESVRRFREDVPYLHLIPRITTTRAPPFLGRSYQHMKNPYLQYQKELSTEGNKVVHSATFTLLFVPEYLEGLSQIYPFLFIIFSIELQWLVNFADNFAAAHMVTAILNLQTITNAQSKYLSHSNKMSHIIYLAYAIAMANILTISLMAFINVCKDKGSLPALVRHRGTIFRTMRLFTILLAFFLIPIMTVKTDHKTGKQTDYIWIHYLIGLGGIAVMALLLFKEYKNAQERKNKMESDCMVAQGLMKALEPDSSWTVEEVGQWIGSCAAVREESSLTEGELEAISDKFVKGGVNGVVFPVVAYDTTALKQDLGLSVGEAVLFVHTMEKLRSTGCPKTMTNSKCDSDFDQQAEIGVKVQATHSSSFESDHSSLG